MPEREDAVFSNPLPPTMRVEQEDEEDDAHPLTNDDFRKLFMTPRHPRSGGSSSRVSTSDATPVKPVNKAPKVETQRSVEDLGEGEEGGEGDDMDDASTRRRKKKSYYARLKKMEDERQKELDAMYRDRAKERREGVNTDYAETEVMSTTADYRAVAPDAKAEDDYAERRKKVIQESKYLGGDMEHTHLVKGLDFALLEKVKAEINSKEEVVEEAMEAVVAEKTEPKEEEQEPQMLFKTKIGRSIFKTLFRTKVPEKNELFAPGRMAYAVDLEDEYVESDIPTTVIRSHAECPSQEATATLTTNDIVISKLTQILSYLRQGSRGTKKMKKKDKAKLKEEDRQKGGGGEDNIYGDLADYVPSYSHGKDRDKRDKEKKDRERDRDRRDRGRDRDRRDRDRNDREKDRDYDRDREKGKDKEREKRKSYFEKPTDEDEVKEKLPNSAKELVQSINDKFAKGWAPADIEREGALKSVDDKAAKKEEERQKKINKKQYVDSYAECYPGMMESADALGDSDDEADFTKMDQGNKKGPVGRWDFDTQEEYSSYMSNKEALPKAAFQYGVKMADGRRTRRAGPKDDKAQLDREWQKIQNIIAKRKQMGTGEGPYAKQPKY